MCLWFLHNDPLDISSLTELTPIYLLHFSLLQDAESKSETSQAISAREHFVFTDTDGQVYHITVEGNTVKDGARIPPDVSLLVGLSKKTSYPLDLLKGHRQWSLLTATTISTSLLLYWILCLLFILCTMIKICLSALFGSQNICYHTRSTLSILTIIHQVCSSIFAVSFVTCTILFTVDIFVLSYALIRKLNNNLQPLLWHHLACF